MAKKLVEGVGTYIAGEYVCKIARVLTPEYSLWKGILRRCYNPLEHVKRPTYKGCSVSEGFKNYQTFATWVNNQIGFDTPGWQIDKDILVKGNTMYG